MGERGVLKKLRCAQVKWEAPEEGRVPVPVEMPGTEFQVEADLALIAMGFVGPEKNRLVPV